MIKLSIITKEYCEKTILFLIFFVTTCFFFMELSRNYKVSRKFGRLIWFIVSGPFLLNFFFQFYSPTTQSSSFFI
jgi:hypothetical protein